MGITWLEVGIVGAIILIIGLVGFGAWSDSKSPNILLKKTEWECAKVEKRTYMQPMMVGKTTTMMPMTDNVCVEYHRY